MALALWVVVVGPLARTMALFGGDARKVLVVGVVTTLVVMHRRADGWWVRWVVAAVGAALVFPSEGTFVALWLAGGVVLAPWVAAGRPPIPFLPAPGPGAAGPVVVLTAVAAWQGRAPDATWQPLLPFLLAAAAPLATRFGHGTVDRWARRLGERAGTVVGAIAFTLLGLLAVVAPWGLQRLVRVDPLGAAAGWAARERRPVQHTRLWAPDPVRRPATGRARVPLVLAGLAGLALFAAGTVGPGRTAEELRATALFDPSAQAPPSGTGDDWWVDEYREDIAWVLDERVALQPFEVYRLLDVETRHVNVHDGRRDTWTAPVCDCERLTVWLYGGSAAFGLDQRDGHTIASELARVAHDGGITLDVHNRGIPGQAHWRSALRFAWDLTSEPAPDLVVFYDGAEEVDAALALADRGLGDVRAPFEAYAEDLYDEIVADATSSTTPAPTGAEFGGWPVATELDPADVAGLAATRYERSRQFTLGTAADVDVTVLHVWQPWQRAGAVTNSDDRRRAEAFEGARTLLDGDVVTIGDRTGPGLDFIDVSRHGEAGARLVAEALLAAIGDDLERLASAGERPR